MTGLAHAVTIERVAPRAQVADAYTPLLAEHHRFRVRAGEADEAEEEGPSGAEARVPRFHLPTGFRPDRTMDPTAYPKLVDFLHRCAELTEGHALSWHEEEWPVAQMWRLAGALWGQEQRTVVVPRLEAGAAALPGAGAAPLPVYDHARERQDCRNGLHRPSDRRAALLSRWLAHCVRGRAQEAPAPVAGAAPAFLEIFGSLSEGRVPDAVVSAISAGEVRLAGMLACHGASSAGTRGPGGVGAGDEETQSAVLAAEQLAKWLAEQHDDFVDKGLQLVYSLLTDDLQHLDPDQVGHLESGVLSPEDCRSTAAALDWQRGLGLRLWFEQAPGESLQFPFQQYTDAFRTCKAAPPLPAYAARHWHEAPEFSASPRHLCVLYRLLELYCLGEEDCRPVDVVVQALMPQAATADPLDYRHAWQLLTLLEAVNFYERLPEDTAAMVIDSFASQLIAVGLWTWSVYAYAHLRDPRLRSHAIRSTVLRHGPDATPAEMDFLQDLGVPVAWLHEARAYARGHGFRTKEFVAALRDAADTSTNPEEAADLRRLAEEAFLVQWLPTHYVGGREAALLDFLAADPVTPYGHTLVKYRELRRATDAARVDTTPPRLEAIERTLWELKDELDVGRPGNSCDTYVAGQIDFQEKAEFCRGDMLTYVLKLHFKLLALREDAAHDFGDLADAPMREHERIKSLSVASWALVRAMQG
uniref:Nuclear pore complex protein NUP96 C-terminal domain-containing protein n=2 Tax=Rhizochromulina marina TaxID=1034831 RepID=A0A7S2R6D9_9STRA